MHNWRRVGAVALAIVGFVLIAFGYANTRAAEVETKSVLISIPCYENAYALGVMLSLDFGEIPIAESIGNMRWFDGSNEKDMVGRGMMFANAQTKTYSNVIIFPDGTACVIGTGIDFKPLKLN